MRVGLEAVRIGLEAARVGLEAAVVRLGAAKVIIIAKGGCCLAGFAYVEAGFSSALRVGLDAAVVGNT